MFPRRKSNLGLKIIFSLSAGGKRICVSSGRKTNLGLQAALNYFFFFCGSKKRFVFLLGENLIANSAILNHFFPAGGKIICVSLGEETNLGLEAARNDI